MKHFLFSIGSEKYTYILNLKKTKSLELDLCDKFSKLDQLFSHLYSSI